MTSHHSLLNGSFPSKLCGTNTIHVWTPPLQTLRPAENPLVRHTHSPPSIIDSHECTFMMDGHLCGVHTIVGAFLKRCVPNGSGAGITFHPIDSTSCNCTGKGGGAGWVHGNSEGMPAPLCTHPCVSGFKDGWEACLASVKVYKCTNNMEGECMCVCLGGGVAFSIRAGGDLSENLLERGKKSETNAVRLKTLWGGVALKYLTQLK